MGLNIGALGSFAGGVARGMSAYQEQALREKELALREQAAAREEEKYQRERESQELLKKAYTPTEGGVSTQEITGALPIGQRAGETGTTPEYRQKFQDVFSKLTPDQQAAVLKGYGSSDTPGGKAAAAAENPLLQAAQLGTTTVRKDTEGKTYAVQPLSNDKAVDRYSQLAGAAGNTTAMKEAIDLKSKQQQIESGEYTIKGLKRTEERNKAEDELAAWHTKTTAELQEKGPQAAAEILVKEYNTGKAHKDGQTAEIVNNSDGTSAIVLKNDKTGKIVETQPVNNASIDKAIQAMAFQKWSALPQNFEKGLNQRREDKKLDIEQSRLGLEGDRVKIAQAQLGYEASRLGMEAGKLGLEWEKFNLEVKNNPKKMAEIDAKIKNYNADANYRNAAAKAAGEKTGNWAVIGTDKDGAAISYNKNDGSAARADGKPIQDIDFFKKVTGEKAVKEAVSNKDVLDFVEKNGDAPSGVKDKNTGKELRVRELPLSEQRQAAEDFYQKGSGSGGMPSPDPKVMKKPGEAPSVSAIPVTAKPAAKPVYGNISPELQQQTAARLQALDISLSEAEKEAQAAAASGNTALIIQAGNKLNQVRTNRDELARSPLLR